MTFRRLLKSAPVAVAASLAAAPPAAADPDFGDRALRRGDRGHDVRVLQSWLTHLGYETGVDGVYGRATDRSVDRYDRANGLEVDHAVSRGQARRMRRQVERGARSRSRRSAERSYSFGERELARGDRGRDVRVLQSWLSHLGIATDVDGVFGRGTERNVERYDEWNGLTVNGEVSRAQARRMRRQVEQGRDMPSSPPPRGGTTSVEGGHVFPIQGEHEYRDGFGAGRNHRGADVFATCGTPLVAAQGGTVRYAGYHDAAGNYAVITGAESGLDYVYMHMRERPLVATGDQVATGQQIGEIGESGNASGCHMHFELWSKPGWYEGGSPFDPVPHLRSWSGG